MTKSCAHCGHMREDGGETYCYHPKCKLSDEIVYQYGNDCRNIFYRWCNGKNFAEKENAK